MALKTIDSKIIVADTTLKTNPKMLRLIFQGTYGSYFLTPGLSFSLEDKADTQELDLLMEITGIMGDAWQSQLVNKEVRLIIDYEEISRSNFRVEVKAIGHRQEDFMDDDLFIVLNSGLQLVNKATAMKIISEDNDNNNNENK